MDEQKNTPNAQGNGNNGNWRKKRNRRRHHGNKNKNRPNAEEKINNTELEEAAEDTAAANEDKIDLSVIEAIEKDSESSLFGTDPNSPEITVEIENEEDAKLVHVAGIRFKANGKIYFFDKSNVTLKAGSHAIVDTARGLEFGEVAFPDREVKESSLVLPLRSVIRAATKEDIEHNRQNKIKEDEAFKICQGKIETHGLEMKLIEAQYSFDNSKLLFYFTSANRVDFRELVKDLASVFKTRIELRQIGIRDEAKIMGGLGACGRALCCTTFLSDFAQVSIKMAKEQNLSLNSGKISGCCGRLMCCLQYEYSTYVEESRRTPPVDSTVKTREGVGVVTESNPLAGTIKVKLQDKPDMAPVLFKREDVTLIARPSKKDND